MAEKNGRSRDEDREELGQSADPSYADEFALEVETRVEKRKKQS